MKNPTKESLGELHPLEVELIITLREKYKYGAVEIFMHEGLPRHILKTVERYNFGKFDVIHNDDDLQKKYPSSTL